MDVPDLADLIALFEDAPTPAYDDLEWPVGRHTFRLTRERTDVRFSLDPAAGDAGIVIAADGQEIVHLGRIRPVERLSITRDRSGAESLRLWVPAVSTEPLVLSTRPTIAVMWNVRAAGQW